MPSPAVGFDDMYIDALELENRKLMCGQILGSDWLTNPCPSRFGSYLQPNHDKTGIPLRQKFKRAQFFFVLFCYIFFG